MDEIGRQLVQLETDKQDTDRSRKLEEEYVATISALEARVQGFETEMEYKQAEVAVRDWPVAGWAREKKTCEASSWGGADWCCVCVCVCVWKWTFHFCFVSSFSSRR